MKWKALLCALTVCALAVAACLPARAAGDTTGVVYTDAGLPQNLPAVTESFATMVPGETRTHRYVLTNNASRKASFYMRSNIARELQGKEGAGPAVVQAKIVHNGDVLYDSLNGGQERFGRNGLGEDVLLAALQPGQHSALEITLTLDGESTPNEFQSALSTLQLVFTVEENDPVLVSTVPGGAVSAPGPTTSAGAPAGPLHNSKTGEDSPAALLAVGSVAAALALLLHSKKKEGAA